MTQIAQMDLAGSVIRDPESHAVIGAAMKVHRALGHGFLEVVYEEAMEIELGRLGIPYQRQVSFPLWYRGTLLRSSYRADLVCYGSIIVELKALRQVGSADQAQLINYLKSSRLTRGLLLNFGTPRLSYRRVVLGYQPSASSA